VEWREMGEEINLLSCARAFSRLESVKPSQTLLRPLQSCKHFSEVAKDRANKEANPLRSFHPALKVGGVSLEESHL